jgi:hypothetical protein
MSELNEEMAAIKKTSRAKSTRSSTARRKPWAPPSKLDAPEAPEGYKHRWIRAEVRGYDDRQNLSARLREGYELVQSLKWKRRKSVLFITIFPALLVRLALWC